MKWIIAIFLFFVGVIVLAYYTNTHYHNEANLRTPGCRYLGSPRELHQVEFYSCGPNNEIIMALTGQPPIYKGE